ncbi:uncharacterized protein A1O5_04362 [Cladophialophora psammophila CBS 110553]|uniref:Alpha/beta hydrolase fold-3 domain-containing protein n=1 Tax=Cladophialophora psammophila CBS 110553 TaxID=1182543 RepID=W9X4N4_9EURO|nr:uncharacterized protein A1O5_04362 [Cladophialophora psammophila CBS 110553]EXJ71861.1 hypothetical protein A1O5_04362 [Cladophialophora psammophila CBS 110553]
MVISVNYRHTPEYKHPTAHNDAWDPFEWLSENISALSGDPNRVIVGGVSAGGWLATSIALRYAEDKIKDKGQLRLHPLPTVPFKDKINAVIPGLIATPLVERLADEYHEGDYEGLMKQKGGTVPLGRQGTADEVANATLFLLSDAASYITGAGLTVDGGTM